MKQKWIYPTLVLFFLFYVLSNPGNAGPQVRSFFSWVGDQAANVGTFLDGLFDDEADPTITNSGTDTSSSTESGGATIQGQSVTVDPAVPVAPESTDTFDTLGPWSPPPLRL